MKTRRHPRLLSGARLLACCAAACVLAAACGSRSDDLTVSGRVEIDRARVGSKIGGRVGKVCFEEGDSVKSGEAIVILESSEPSAQLDQALALAAQARAGLDLLLAGTRTQDIQKAEALVVARRAELALRRAGFRDEEIREARARVASAESAVALARKEASRAEALLRENAGNKQELDSRQASLEAALAALEVARQQHRLAQSGSRPEEIRGAEALAAQAQAELERLKSGSRPEEIAAQRAAVDAAQANVARLESQLAETRILAPSDSVVETLDLEAGDLVKPGETVAILMLKGNPWVRCYVPANHLGRVKPGRRVTVTVDAYPGREFPGVVRRVNAEAEFTPRNVQTSEKRAELVFEMKVDVTANGDALRAGMFADVRVGGAPKP